MTLFWTLVAAVLLLSLAIIWYPFLKKRHQASRTLSRAEQNVAIFKERVTELEAERAAGTLDDRTFEDLRRELELNLLNEVDDAEEPGADGRDQESPIWLPLGLSLVVPALALVLYLQYGASDLLDQPRQVPSTANQAPHDMTNMEAAITALKQRLEADPNNREGWFMLGRTYMTLERYEDAFIAFRKLGELTGENAEVLALQAQAIYYGMDHQLVAEAAALLDRALELDPGDPGTLGLLGIAAYESGQYQEAIGYWQKALDGNRPGLNREGLQSAIAQAVEQLRQQGIDYQLPQQKEQAATGAELKVAVSLAPELAERLPADTTLFIYAQAANGPRMPLAVARMQLGDLPVEVRLNDSMAMAPMARLSQFDQVVIRATATRSGTPGAQPGDLIGETGPVAVKGNDDLIHVVIDRQVQ